MGREGGCCWWCPCRLTSLPPSLGGALCFLPLPWKQQSMRALKRDGNEGGNIPAPHPGGDGADKGISVSPTISEDELSREISGGRTLLLRLSLLLIWALEETRAAEPRYQALESSEGRRLLPTPTRCGGEAQGGYVFSSIHCSIPTTSCYTTGIKTSFYLSIPVVELSTDVT